MKPGKRTWTPLKLALIITIPGCGGSEPPTAGRPDPGPEPQLPSLEQLELYPRLERELERRVRGFFVCLVIPGPSEPMPAYVRPGPKVQEAARQALERLGATGDARVRVTTSFETNAGLRRLEHDLRMRAPEGVDVNADDGPVSRTCPRIALQIPPGDGASEEALAWASDTIKRLGSDTLYIERVRSVDD